MRGEEVEGLAFGVWGVQFRVYRGTSRIRNSPPP